MFGPYWNIIRIIIDTYITIDKRERARETETETTRQPKELSTALASQAQGWGWGVICSYTYMLVGLLLIHLSELIYTILNSILSAKFNLSVLFIIIMNVLDLFISDVVLVQLACMLFKCIGINILRTIQWTECNKLLTMLLSALTFKAQSLRIAISCYWKNPTSVLLFGLSSFPKLSFLCIIAGWLSGWNTWGVASNYS